MLLRAPPCLRGLIFDRANARRGSGSSEILEKKFPGGLLAMCVANSAAGLAMRPPVRIICDETDRFPASAGGRGFGEGDPIELAGKRKLVAIDIVEDVVGAILDKAVLRDATREALQELADGGAVAKRSREAARDRRR